MAKPRLSLQVEDMDRRGLDAVAGMLRNVMPGLGRQTLSVVMRASMRLGLKVLALDPKQAPEVPELLATDIEAWEALAQPMRQADAEAAILRASFDRPASEEGSSIGQKRKRAKKA